jgi:hypothetical protein
MATFASMPYGVAGTFDSVRISHGFADLQFWVGTQQCTFFRNKTIDLACSSRIILPVAGIAANAGGLGESGSLKSFSHNQDEALIEPLSEPRYPENDIQDGLRLEKYLAASFMVVGITHTFNIQGRGRIPFNVNQQGVVVGAKTFNVAWGTGFSIVTPATTILRTLSIDKSKADVWNWTADLWAWVSNPTCTTHPLTPPPEVLALILPNTISKYASSASMSEGTNRPQSNWTVTMYPTD